MTSVPVDALALALACAQEGVDPRTVRNVLAGGKARTGLSASRVGRVLTRLGLQPPTPPSPAAGPPVAAHINP